jgi:hypothetical protein
MGVVAQGISRLITTGELLALGVALVAPRQTEKVSLLGGEDGTRR